MNCLQWSMRNCMCGHMIKMSTHHHANDRMSAFFHFMNNPHKDILTLILGNCSNLSEYQSPPVIFLPKAFSTSVRIWSGDPFAYFATSTGL